MATLTPKEFIQKVLINETGEIHEKYAYISFAVMAIGIEFLGKCINRYEDWNEPSRSKKDFELAINNLDSFIRYRPLLTSNDLWTSLRNGFLHSFVPKDKISLSSKDEAAHLVQISANQINLRCEDFYIDFKGACEQVLEKTDFLSSKMDRPLLRVPSMGPTVSSAPSDPSISEIKISGATH